MPCHMMSTKFLGFQTPSPLATVMVTQPSGTTICCFRLTPSPTSADVICEWHSLNALPSTPLPPFQCLRPRRVHLHSLQSRLPISFSARMSDLGVTTSNDAFPHCQIKRREIDRLRLGSFHQLHLRNVKTLLHCICKPTQHS